MCDIIKTLIETVLLLYLCFDCSNTCASSFHSCLELILLSINFLEKGIFEYVGFMAI